MIYLICNECGWQGDPSELVSKTDAVDDRDFSFCPQCEESDFEEEEEEDGT